MAEGVRALRGAIDWGKLGPIRIRSRLVADGVLAGSHRSVRRGAGIEFAGHRAYVPGDELRFVDVRASMRHERVIVRQFETETDRALRLVVDATRSMSFRSKGAPCDKLAFAALVGASLARVSLVAGDPVGLDAIGGEDFRRVPPSARMETLERIFATFESMRASGDARDDVEMVERALDIAVRGARRGSVIVVLSDFIDLADGADDAIAALATRGRTLVGVQILDPEERSFPFEGPVVLRASEGQREDGARVQTDGPSVRAAYLRSLDARIEQLSSALGKHGGTLVGATTTDDPIDVTRAIVRAAATLDHEAREAT
jgi:uncharacterized protein (DUF58 family)